MKEFIKEAILSPMLRRGGTIFGGYLLGLGVTQDQTTQIITGLTAVLLVVMDLVFSASARKVRV